MLIFLSSVGKLARRWRRAMPRAGVERPFGALTAIASHSNSRIVGKLGQKGAVSRRAIQDFSALLRNDKSRRASRNNGPTVEKLQ
jgi:hypothetical protein